MGRFPVMCFIGGDYQGCLNRPELKQRSRPITSSSVLDKSGEDNMGVQGVLWNAVYD